MYSKRWHRTCRANVLKEVALVLEWCLLKETPLITGAHLFEVVAPVTVCASTQEVGNPVLPGWFHDLLKEAVKRASP
jgi:hypothetical protein